MSEEFGLSLVEERDGMKQEKNMLSIGESSACPLFVGLAGRETGQLGRFSFFKNLQVSHFLIGSS